MIKKFFKKIKGILYPPLSENQKIKKYLNCGRIPWTIGYNEYKWQEIQKTLNNYTLISSFNHIPILENYGVGIDERVVEYPWIFSNLSNRPCKLLDAGSTFNFKTILDHSIISVKEKTIITYYPEYPNYNNLKINYIYSDLREIPIKDEYYDEIVCQSTLEHIDMDNSIYGYNADFKSIPSEKSYEYLKVVKELIRVLKPGGILLITIPFGTFENHGFFQQFDYEMADHIINSCKSGGSVVDQYFIYKLGGWEFSTRIECQESKSFNPHTGIGKGVDNAAHSRAICCIKFSKNK